MLLNGSPALPTWQDASPGGDFLYPTWLWSSVQRGDKKPRCRRNIATENRANRQDTTRESYPRANGVISPTHRLPQWWSRHQFDRQILCMWIMQLYHWWATERFNRSRLDLPSKCYSTSDKISFDSGRISKGTSFRKRMSSCWTRSWTPWLLLIVERLWNPQKDSTNRRSLLEGFLRHITCPHLIIVLLPHATRTS